MPYDWRTALGLKGAWDVSFAKWIFEIYNLFNLEPKQELVLNETEEIRMAVSNDLNKVVIYVPFNITVKINMDLSQYDFTLINMSEKHFTKAELNVKSGITLFEAHPFNCDVLIVGKKQVMISNIGY